MDDSPWLRLVLSLSLVLGNAFFVASEYALVGCRKSRIDALAKRGARSAKLLQHALDNVAPYIAGIQIAITMLSIGVGSVAEPFVRSLLETALGANVSKTVSYVVSFVVVTYVMVVLGELVPKFISLERAEKVALFAIRPLRFLVAIIKPLIWIIERSGYGAARLLGVRKTQESDALSKDELVLMLKSGSTQGLMDKVHAEMVSKTMQFDQLDSSDIMVHRLDIKWLDVRSTRDETLEQFKKIRHTRIPICNGDIDDVVGVVYVNDLVNHLSDDKFNLESIARPPIVVPENLALDRLVGRMREEKTQILIVVDEYGGTAGLITLEDVIEEIFGELDDSLESERAPIELHGSRVSAKADVRYDELLAFLGMDEESDEPTRETLANVMVRQLERMPKMGDVITTELGQMRIENMARRRVTRVSLVLNAETQAKVSR